MFLDVRPHFLRNQIPDGTTGTNNPSNLRAGDLQRSKPPKKHPASGGVDIGPPETVVPKPPMHGSGQGSSAHGTATWPLDHDPVAQMEKLVVTPPGGDLQEGIQPQQEEQLGFPALLLPKNPEGLHRVRRAGSSALQVGNLEDGMTVRGPAHHLDTMDGGSHETIGLVGRLSGRDEKDSGQGKGLPRFLGRPKVPIVDGIEGSPEDPDPHVTGEFDRHRR
jgi:hypothetical protein